jgi:hypothetical protein
MNFLMGVAKGALDRGSELIEERSQRRQQMVDQLTVKYLETAEKAKARRAVEKQNVTKAAQFFKQNNLPPELLERAILGAKSPDDILENAMAMGSQWQRARTNEQTRGMFSGPADQFDRDYSEGYSDLQGMTERLSTGPTEDSPIGSTGGFGTPVAEAASNQAFKDAAGFAGMRPEELAGTVRNAPRGSEAGLGATEGISMLTEQELEYIKSTQPSAQKVSDMTSIGKEVAKRIAEDMGIDAIIMPDGSVNFGAVSAKQKQEFSRRVTEAQALIYEEGGAPELAETYRRAIGGNTAQPTSGSGMQSAVQQYVEKFRRVKKRDPSPQEVQEIEQLLRQRGVQ